MFFKKRKNPTVFEEIDNYYEQEYYLKEYCNGKPDNKTIPGFEAREHNRNLMKNKEIAEIVKSVEKEALDQLVLENQERMNVSTENKSDKEIMELRRRIFFNSDMALMLSSRMKQILKEKHNIDYKTIFEQHPNRLY